MARVVQEKEMSVSIAALARAITDFESYPKFLPEVIGATIQPGSTDEIKRVEFEIEVVKRFQYTLEFRIRGNEEIAWRLVESNFFKMNEGKWVLKADGEKKTKVLYELEVSFGFMVPGFISRKLTEVSLPRMFENFEGQARSLS